MYPCKTDYRRRNAVDQCVDHRDGRARLCGSDELVEHTGGWCSKDERAGRDVMKKMCEEMGRYAHSSL